MSTEVDFECELAVVIGRTCKNATRASALDYVLGYTAANDVSARDWQMKWNGGQFCQGKSFDTFCPMGPVLVTRDEIPDPNKLRIRTLLNGQAMQDWNTDDMVFDVAALIEFLSGSKTLLPGTVILTGTPHGVGYARKPPVFLKAGDIVTIDIEGIGALVNPVHQMTFGSLPSAATAWVRSESRSLREMTATCAHGASAPRRDEVVASARMIVPVSATAPAPRVIPNWKSSTRVRSNAVSTLNSGPKCARRPGQSAGSQ